MDINMLILKNILKNTDWDIDKNYRIPIESLTNREELCYRRIKSIIKSLSEDKIINWDIAFKKVDKDLVYLNTLLKQNLLLNKEEFIKCIKLYKSFYDQYNTCVQTTLNIIESKLMKKEKSIDDMDADELRDYIKKHNIK